jgi:hypothetical protein
MTTPIRSGTKAKENAGNVLDSWQKGFVSEGVKLSEVATTIADLVVRSPRGLTTRPRWVLWKRTREGARLPINSRTGALAKSNDRSTWSTLADTIRAYSTGRFQGVSYALGDGHFGIDLDACIGEDGEVAPWAEEVLDQFPTYAELSPSGTGVKIYGIGEYTGTGINHRIGAPTTGKTAAIEVSGWGRFFAFTGKRFGPQEQITNCQRPLNSIVKRLSKPVPHVPGPRAIMRHTAMTERAARWMAKVEPAVSGRHGHSATFRVACRLVDTFRLSFDETYSLLTHYSQRCEPPWSERELIHKVREAFKKHGRTP